MSGRGSEGEPDLAQEAKIELEKAEGVSREDIEAALVALSDDGVIDSNHSYAWVKTAVQNALKQAEQNDDGLVEIQDKEENKQKEGIPVDYLIEGLLQKIGHGDTVTSYKGIVENEDDRETWGETPDGNSGKESLISKLEAIKDASSQGLCELAIKLIKASHRYYEIKRPSTALDGGGQYSGNHWRTKLEAHYVSRDGRGTSNNKEENYIKLAEKELTRRLEVRLGSSAVAPPPPEPPEPPQPPQPPEPEPIHITGEQAGRATKEAGEIIAAMQAEEKNRLIERALDRAGFFGSLLFRKKIIKEVESAGEYQVPESIQKTIKEYTLSKVINKNITASGGEVFRLMDKFGYKTDREGQFIPPHPDSNTGWLGRLLRPNRAKTTGATFLGGMALGHIARNAIAGVLGAVGGGALAGGLFGFLRGKREAAEATTSGESWTRELDAALASQDDLAIEVACHKVERIFADENARNEFFRDRTRMEASKILERYREGIRRLSLNRMANEEAGSEPYAIIEERNNAVAEKYAAFCHEMAEGEEQFMRTYTEAYQNALGRELRIISVSAQSDLNLNEKGQREAVEKGYNRDTNERRRIRRGIVARSAIRGALVGGIAGGIGWYVGNLLSNLSGGGGEIAAVGTGEEAGGSAVGTGTSETPQHWGLFSNENYMREQGFTVAAAKQQGFEDILNHPDCPTQVFDGVAYAGTDQGAALREAVLTWKDLDLRGMDQVRLANLMNFAGDPSVAPGVDAGSYRISLEQVQAVIDHIRDNGEIGILDANKVMANVGMREVATAIATSPVGEAGQEAAKTMWPGWPLIAGAAGYAGGYGVDNARRRAELDATNASGPIAPPPLGVRGPLAPIAPRPPEPEPESEPAPGPPSTTESIATEPENTGSEERKEKLKKKLQIEGLYNTDDLISAIEEVDEGITLPVLAGNIKARALLLVDKIKQKANTTNNFDLSALFGNSVSEGTLEQLVEVLATELLRNYDELQSLGAAKEGPKT
ncbi:MAG TPA: hypothetical protein PLX55_01105 [bacterium]|jgi:hypothetical protein|nr:hypothetical protein [bacterium]